MFAVRSRFALITLLSGYSFLNALLLESFRYYPININKLVIFLLFLAVIGGIWEGNRLLDHYISSKRFRRFWISFVYQIAGSIIITAAISLILGSIIAYLTLAGNPLGWLLPVKLLLMFSLRINLFLNTIHLIFVYHAKLKRSREELENYKRVSSQAQLQSLKNQINPHFLFNNLSVLSAMIPDDPAASIEFVRQFSRVYRYVLKSHKKEIVPLKEELDFIESYLYLLKKRFGSGLVIKVDLSTESLSAHIVPISLQMLVENAIKHNIVSKNKPLKIEILSPGNKSVTVRNNFQPKTGEEESTRVGLSNIAKRYEFLGYKGIRIKHTDEFFSVSLPLIYMKENINIYDASFAS